MINCCASGYHLFGFIGTITIGPRVKPPGPTQILPVVSKCSFRF